MFLVFHWAKLGDDDDNCCHIANVADGFGCWCIEIWFRGWFFSRERLFWNQTRMTFSSRDNKRDNVSICVGSG